MDDENEHTYSLSILTPEKVAFEDQVYSTIVPGADGYLEVLAHHAPIMVLIQTGKLTIIDKNDKTHIYAISGGVLEVSQNNANLLVDSIESGEEIDLERARSAYERARTRLISQDKDIDLIRAKAALKRAENRIHIYEESHP